MKLLTPHGTRRTVFAPQMPQRLPGPSLPGCSAPGGCSARRQIGTQTSCPVPPSPRFLLVCFVSRLPNGAFSSAVGTVEALAGWHGSCFSLPLSLSELLLHCSHPVPFAFCGISISLQKLLQCTITLWMCFISPEPQITGAMFSSLWSLPSL